MMRFKFYLVYVLVSVMALFSISSLGMAGVQGSLHDFTITAPFISHFGGTFNGDNAEVCVYCHTPHSSYGSQTPLWNKNLNTSATYSMYTSATMDASATAPSTYSLLCLSCHDGVGAINAVLNAPGPGAGSITTSGIDQIGDLGTTADSINIGHGDPASPGGPFDLTDDHPISITYPTSSPTEFKTTPDANLKLYGGKVECPTCHDPHNGSGRPNEVQFLRMSNQGSAMCLGCHIK